MRQPKGSNLNSAADRVRGSSSTSSFGTLRQIRCSCSIAASFLLLSVAGCEKVAVPAGVPVVNPEIAWTSAALSRNPDVEVLATDSAAGVFTVRIKSTGEVKALRLAEVAAAPISQLSAQPQVIAAVSETTTTSREPPAAMADARPGLAATDAAPTATAASAQTSAQAAAASPASATPNDANYTIDRAGGQIKVSGPGVSIVSSGSTSPATTSSADAASTDPVICEGQRLLHLDNRKINAAGNGVIARGGCELYITNSRIIATGTAVIVNDAVVHIANSSIEGTVASIDADDRARVLVRSSTFKGVQRRGERASIQDQGGNQWH